MMGNMGNTGSGAGQTGNSRVMSQSGIQSQMTAGGR